MGAVLISINVTLTYTIILIHFEPLKRLHLQFVHIANCSSGKDLLIGLLYNSNINQQNISRSYKARLTGTRLERQRTNDAGSIKIQSAI